MSVHLQIKEQMNKFIAAEREYKQLDMSREQMINEVIIAAKTKKEFSLVEINSITEQLNNLSKSFNFPIRKKVTKEMVFEFIHRK